MTLDQIANFIKRVERIAISERAEFVRVEIKNFKNDTAQKTLARTMTFDVPLYDLEVWMQLAKPIKGSADRNIIDSIELYVYFPDKTKMGEFSNNWKYSVQIF
ncbi:hypothetical protein LEP1GSC050_0076 [Leptospira phage vB_LbrZ_5399-LE1]|uniref:Phage protein n=1 Tax=Leptospira inadai serovar Lyme TaxID=293084 RepID=A0ABX4YGM4_9LEPT|nr:hypothetical protein [Leptospira inadai]AGS80747.1 hypothetical protein LEP1GSC050_0076 [Leptospira phage vB_LbrZ_5399-LE1]PNV74339.1 hypothetical protein BES34_014225 [Leptospira inadai serovar Lyme]